MAVDSWSSWPARSRSVPTGDVVARGGTSKPSIHHSRYSARTQGLGVQQASDGQTTYASPPPFSSSKANSSVSAGSTPLPPSASEGIPTPAQHQHQSQRVAGGSKHNTEPSAQRHSDMAIAPLGLPMTLASHLCLIGTGRKILNAFPIGNLDHRRCGTPWSHTQRRTVGVSPPVGTCPRIGARGKCVVDLGLTGWTIRVISARPASASCQPAASLPNLPMPTACPRHGYARRYRILGPKPPPAKRGDRLGGAVGVAATVRPTLIRVLRKR